MHASDVCDGDYVVAKLVDHRHCRRQQARALDLGDLKVRRPAHARLVGHCDGETASGHQHTTLPSKGVAWPESGALAAERPGQRERERERERRVSDADASYYGPPVARNDSQLRYIPKRKHANNNSLSKNDPVPLPRSPSKLFDIDHRDRPKPDLMFSGNHPACRN